MDGVLALMDQFRQRCPGFTDLRDDARTVQRPFPIQRNS